MYTQWASSASGCVRSDGCLCFSVSDCVVPVHVMHWQMTMTTMGQCFQSWWVTQWPVYSIRSQWDSVLENGEAMHWAVRTRVYNKAMVSSLADGDRLKSLLRCRLYKAAQINLPLAGAHRFFILCAFARNVCVCGCVPNLVLWWMCIEYPIRLWLPI